MLETNLSPARRVPRHSALAPVRDTPTRTRRRASDSDAIPRSPQGRRLAIGPNRLARSEANMMCVALATITLVCCLLLPYLATYAHLWQIGVRQDKLRKELKTLQWQNQTLQAQVAACRNPRLVAEQAQTLGMAPGTRLAESIGASEAGAAPQTQGDKSGQTTNQRVASRGH